MRKQKVVSALIVGSLALTPLAGCEDLPGTRRQQGAVIGGVAGAGAGAAIAKDNRLLGALIGGALGAGGGYLIGAQTEKVKDEDREKTQREARDAVERAQQSPASVEDVRDATTADLNNDGFVTMDEIEAMHNAGLNDDEIIARMEATGQIFELTEQQEQMLRDRGLSDDVVARMRTVNQEQRDRLLEERQTEVLGRPTGDRI